MVEKKGRVLLLFFFFLRTNNAHQSLFFWGGGKNTTTHPPTTRFRDSRHRQRGVGLAVDDVERQELLFLVFVRVCKVKNVDGLKNDMREKDGRRKRGETLNKRQNNPPKKREMREIRERRFQRPKNSTTGKRGCGAAGHRELQTAGNKKTTFGGAVIERRRHPTCFFFSLGSQRCKKKKRMNPSGRESEEARGKTRNGYEEKKERGGRGRRTHTHTIKRNPPSFHTLYAFWGSLSRSSTAGESAARSHAVLPSTSCGKKRGGGGGLKKIR